MKTIRLNKLSLRNFQGGSFELLANGEDINIFADNGIGKTRLFSAFTWLLFGKDSLNRSDFSLKNLNAHGDVADHDLQHTVEGVLNIDGEEVILKKIYSEKFIKTRGKPTSEFSGHSTQHFINDVPKQEKDYKAYIQEITGDEQIFRLLTSPTAFPTLQWQKQRALLLEIFGDVSDADIIASESKLSDLPKILGKHKVDDYKKIIAARQNKLTESLGTTNRIGTIETRIDEVRHSLPDVTGLDRTVLERDVSRLETAVGNAKLKLQGVDTGGTIADLTKRLAGINADLQKMESVHYAKIINAVNEMNQQVTEITEMLNANKRRITSINGELKSKDGRLQGIKVDLVALRQQWAENDVKQFQDTTIDTCAACGQSLPSERVEEARQKALGAFNMSKAERIEDINKRGKYLADEQNRLQGEIDAMSKEREIVESGIPATEDQLKIWIAKRDTVKQEAKEYNTYVPGHLALATQKIDIEAAIQAEKNGHIHDRDEIQAEVDDWTRKLLTAKAMIDRFVSRTQGEERINDLKDEEKKLAAESEKLASESFLIDLFTRIKVNMLNDKMTGQFEIVNWKLAEVQVNGAVNDQMCELTVNGIGYNSGLNSAGRTNAGLDVCRTLSRYYKILAPIFIDNAESISHPINMQAQVIRLVVSAEDAVLRVEAARQAVAA